MHHQARCVARLSTPARSSRTKWQSGFYPLACGGLLLNAVALGFAWCADIINISTDATIHLPFGLGIPVMREEKTFSLLGSLAEFYDTGQIVIFLIVTVFGIVVPIAKLIVSAILVLRPSTPCAEQLLTVLHRIGRWAMVDVFALAIVTATLKLGDTLNVEIRPGFYWFVAAALIPMLNGIFIEKTLSISQLSTDKRSHIL